MGVVRELVNRISFKINPGDKAKAENAMKGIEAKGAGTIAFFKGLGGAIDTALKAIAGLTAAGAKMFTEYESNQAVSRFFSRSVEEVKQLSDALDTLSGSEIISKREREQAKALFSKITPDVDQIVKILPILEDITIARPDLDFEQVVELTTQFVKTGDIDALENLGAVGKDTAEAFRLAQLNASTAIKGQRNLFQFLAEGLDRNKEKIKENADLVRDDLGFSFKALAKEASDFTLQFGEETAKPIKEIVIIARDLIKELNESDEFWEGVRSGAEATLEIIKEAIQLAKILKGEEEDPAQPKSQREALDILDKPTKEIERPTPFKEAARFIGDIQTKGISTAFEKSVERLEAFREQQAEKAKTGEAPLVELEFTELLRRLLTGTLPGSKGFSEDIKEYERLIEENKKTGPFIIPGSADEEQPKRTKEQDKDQADLIASVKNKIEALDKKAFTGPGIPEDIGESRSDRPIITKDFKEIIEKSNESETIKETIKETVEKESLSNIIKETVERSSENETIKETIEKESLNNIIKETVKTDVENNTIIKEEQKAQKEAQTATPGPVFPSPQQKVLHEISFTPLIIQGENLEGLDLATISSELNKSVINEVRDTFISAAAQSGRLVGVSG